MPILIPGLRSLMEIAEHSFPLPQEAVEKLESVANGAPKKARAWLNSADGAVRENPWWALGVAAAFGLTLGLLVCDRD